eukprot:COSAG02_NODE_4986_length_4749_cov_4.965806_3_plen_81_part_00
MYGKSPQILAVAFRVAADFRKHTKTSRCHIPHPCHTVSGCRFRLSGNAHAAVLCDDSVTGSFLTGSFLTLAVTIDQDVEK